MLFDIIRVSLLKVFPKANILKLLLDGGVIQVVKIKPSLGLLPLNPPCFAKFDGHCGLDKAMVCQAVVRVDHSPYDVHITVIAGSNNDNEVPLLGAGVSPRCLKFIFLPNRVLVIMKLY